MFWEQWVGDNPKMEDLIDKLDNYLFPAETEPRKVLNVLEYKQLHGMSVKDFAFEVTQLVNLTEFKGNQVFLRAAFLNGLKSRKIRSELSYLETENFDSLVEKARKAEESEQSSKIQGNPEPQKRYNSFPRQDKAGGGFGKLEVQVL